MVFCQLRALAAKSCYAAKHWDCFLSCCDNYNLLCLEGVQEDKQKDSLADDREQRAMEKKTNSTTRRKEETEEDRG